MAKKGFFSWFRKDKSSKEQTVEQDSASTLAEETQAKEAAEQAERDAQAARLVQEAEQQAEAEHLAKAAAIEAEEAKQVLEKAAAEQAERDAQVARLAQEAEQQAEAERLAKAAAIEAEEAKQALEKEAAEQAERDVQAARLAQEVEQQAEAERLAKAAAIEAEEAKQALEKEAAEQAECDAQAAQLAQEAEQQAEAERLAKAAAIEAEKAKQALENEVEQAKDEQQPEPQEKPAKEGLFARLKRSLKRTSDNIGSGFIGLFRGKKIDDELFEELEEQLLIADVGVETTTRLINSLTDHASRKQLKDAEALYELLQQEMQKTLEPVAIPLIPEGTDGPFVILMVGVNGVGKTTTIGKLAKQYQSQGKSVMLAAGDTFRAAAVEQLQVWGQRNDIPVIAQHTGADSASVLFDALQAAKARNVDVLIADTAGRLQNKSHLMEELKKVVRVMKKHDEAAPHEVMLTLDASTGQNAISQAQLFQEAVGVTGITLTKLDGTAKGGVIFAIADKFAIPIRHIGVGEQIDDLRAFHAKDFIDALFDQDSASSE
ncbi:signal recognition particle-docking protein FtsY [Parashewanella spongiae]|uniref:Signal recognition particle receptor FtsY n=1 Tax=Parashewanella spongiae TaxID=342950 RepID=A0A3A6TS00_9GAMM|nr:signal recognition particle-docking protein FtsY [Parashewanella spongiae]MCL1078984.1 signal recognition particle-docking protein FtsY [Parashewanella spongiae]RJY11323.1 signal recognition particle-docking protein FtsY [Parashewanella spongiae]